MSDSEEPNKEDLVKQVELSGKPLEIVVSSLLDKYGWKSITNTDTFVDREKQVFRDIDICAALSEWAPRIGNLQLETYLLFECKNDPGMAWIFFTRPFKFKVDDIAGHYIDEIQMATRNTEYTEIMKMVLSKARLHYDDPDFQRIAVTHDRVFLPESKKYDSEPKNPKKKKTKDHILEAKNQLKKYIDWSTDQDVRKRSQVLPYTIEMFFPCILFQGHMYEAIVKDDGHVELERKEHILLETLFRSPYSVYEKNILIDVISDKPFGEKCLSRYEKLIRKDIASLKKVVAQNSQEIERKMSDTLELIESTRKSG